MIYLYQKLAVETEGLRLDHFELEMVGEASRRTMGMRAAAPLRAGWSGGGEAHLDSEDVEQEPGASAAAGSPFFRERSERRDSLVEGAASVGSGAERAGLQHPWLTSRRPRQ